MLNKKSIELIQSLKLYLNTQLTGDELLTLWENEVELRELYYNLCHLVADEDIRAKDELYCKTQFTQLERLIDGLEQGESLEKLRTISFL